MIEIRILELFDKFHGVAQGWTNRSPFPARRFSHLQTRLGRIWSPPSLRFSECRFSVPRAMRPDHDLDDDLALRLWLSGAMSLLLLCAFVAFAGHLYLLHDKFWLHLKKLYHVTDINTQRVYTVHWNKSPLAALIIAQVFMKFPLPFYTHQSLLSWLQDFALSCSPMKPIHNHPILQWSF